MIMGKRQKNLEYEYLLKAAIQYTDNAKVNMVFPAKTA